MPDRNTWRTPPELFNAVNEVFNFGVDLAADDDNHLCPEYYTFDRSAFNPITLCYIDRPVWCNPPFGTISSFCILCSTSLISVIVFLLTIKMF